MDGVSGRVLSGLATGAKTRGIDLDDLYGGRPGSVSALLDERGRVSWDAFRDVARCLADVLGGPEALGNLAGEESSSDPFKLFRTIGRVVASPRDLYVMGIRWIGPSLFPMVHAEMVEEPDGTLVQTVEIKEGFAPSPEFFYLCYGTLRDGPRSWGHDASRVEMRMGERSAVYRIHPAAARRGLWRRFRRAIRARLAFPAMLREIESQQERIEANYRELELAHAQIQAQATDLELVNAIGREISAEIDLDRVVEILIRVLRVELGVRGVTLHLFPLSTPLGDESSDSPPRPYVREEGDRPGRPSREVSLIAATHRVGRLSIWRRGDSSDAAQDVLLERLLPWIAVALHNARTHQELELHAEWLTERVRERTARLVAANHHLVREIDERKRATDALMESEAQRRESERLASIGTLAAGIAHEINNPIGSILAAAQMAQLSRQDESSPDEIEHALSDIIAEAKRCGGIVRSVLQFSRDEQTDKWDCRAQDLIRRARQLIQPYAQEREVTIDMSLPDEPCWVHVNPIQIEQALVNLLRNAVEAGGRRVALNAHHQAAERRLLVEVLDDGPGIAEHDRMRIFEPFYTTKRPDGGTGLGLSVVHGIAVEHEGVLKIEASPEGGVSALLELPTVMPAPPALPVEKQDGAKEILPLSLDDPLD